MASYSIFAYLFKKYWKKKVPRWASITIIFIALFIIIGIIIRFIAPPIAEQIENLINQIPALQHEIQYIINFALDQMEDYC